jgi:hypothetical protein
MLPGGVRSGESRAACHGLFLDDDVAYARSMRALRIAIATFTLLPTLVAADPLGVAKESGKTVGHAARDGAQTAGRTVRDFFKHGPHTAKRTWKANAARTKADAHADKERVKQEAHDER